ncbi:MAG: hypothetical protein ACK5BJ_04875 [Bacteroidota bacterium]
MRRLVYFNFFFIVYIFSFQAQENKDEFDAKQEIVVDGKRYRIWHNYITGGSFPGASINSAIPTSQTCAALDFNFHIKKEYFQAGVLLSGNVFGDWNNSAMHLCWGKKIEKTKYLFAAYGGVDYSLFYPWEKDSVPARFISPAINAVGAYLAIQNFWKLKYDVGAGCTTFFSYNTKQYLVGIRMELFFSSAFRGEKGRRKISND